MTPEERVNLFSKECWSIHDVQDLFGMPYPTASEYIRKVKTKLTVGMGKELRVDVNGRLHVQDYLDYVGNTTNRYEFKATGELQENVAN